MKEGLIPPGGPRSVCGWVLSDREGVHRQKTRIRDVCPTGWNEKSVCVWLMDRAPCNSTLQHETGGSRSPALRYQTSLYRDLKAVEFHFQWKEII